MAPTLNDKTADNAADKIEKHLAHGDGLASVRDEVEKVRKEQGNNFDKDQFKAWTQKVEDKLHKDGILPRLDITFCHDKVELGGISGDGKFDGKGDLVTQSGKDGRFDFTYNKNGELTSIKDAKGQVDYQLVNGKWTDGKNDKDAELAVDSRGNIHVMHDNGTETLYRRTGEVTEHDDQGRVISQTGSQGRERTYEYDDQGNVKTFSETDKNGQVIKTATRNADGTYTATAAGADGKTGTADDQTSQIKNIEIDNDENLKITNPDGSYMTERGLGARNYYDKTDRLTDLQTTNGKNYHYDYKGDGKDPVGLTITSRGADGQFGTSGNPGDDKTIANFKLKDGQITETDENGKTETYKGSIGIDDRGRALVTNADKDTETTYGLSGAIKVKTHDHVTQVVNPDGTVSNFKYDGDTLTEADLFKGTDKEQHYVMKNGKWVLETADGSCKETDLTPTVDDFGNVRLTKPDADGHFTMYTPMGDTIEGYNEPKLSDASTTGSGDTNPGTAPINGDNSQPPSNGDNPPAPSNGDNSQPPSNGDNPAPSSGATATDLVDPSVAAQDNLADHFGVRLLQKIGAPVTPENIKFLNAWQKAEGGSADNPFNTTQDANGAVVYNSAGVKRYPSVDVGLEATADTLNNGLYGNIVASLQQGNDASATASALTNSPWGTGQLVQQILAG